MASFEVIRDPLWDNIRLDRAALDVLDTRAFQRLRYVRQLGHAFLVYPGATHSRFEHALGAYHLTKRALESLSERGDLRAEDEGDGTAVRLAALLHDIGHYPFSHSLEEAGFEHHELLGERRLSSPDLARVLTDHGGADCVTQLGDLIHGRSNSPLQGLISGSIDLDKIDYLSRDAWMCGVPYGTVDVDRPLASLTLVDAGGGDGRREVGVLEKGMSALESLLFAKYQMYRNVYWHHAVRAATCMFKRAVRCTVRAGALNQERLAQATDGALMEQLFAGDPTGLATAVHDRRLYKRALDIPAAELHGGHEWPATDPGLLERVEDRVARDMGLRPGELLIDYPSRDTMLAADLPVRLRDGTVVRLTPAGRRGQFGLPAVSEALYESARRLRVFVASPPGRSVDLVRELVLQPAEEIRAWLGEGGV